MWKQVHQLFEASKRSGVGGPARIALKGSYPQFLWEGYPETVDNLPLLKAKAGCRIFDCWAVFRR